METLTLTIVDVVYRGSGLARHEGMVVFVPGALTGEVITAEITKKRKKHAEARLVEVLEPSPSRILPLCPLTDVCPGCAYQHVRYDEEIRLKHSQLVNFLERTRQWDASSKALEPVACQSGAGYRNKITLHVGAGDPIKLGYVGEDNRTIIDVPKCPLAMTAINERLAKARADAAFMASLKGRQNVTFRYTEDDGALLWVDDTSPGKERLTEASPWGPIRVPRRSFYQVNSDVTRRLLSNLQETIQGLAPETVIDSHCGVGVFALAASKADVSNVTGIDIDAKAIRAAEVNARQLELENVRFLSGRARELLGDVLCKSHGSKTLLIVDPPRRGLERETTELIAESDLPFLVYISCAADTLARDVKQFGQSGFRIASTQLFDMFPRTPFFESVTVLER